jgi:hypothetical protein
VAPLAVSFKTQSQEVGRQAGRAENVIRDVFSEHVATVEDGDDATGLTHTLDHVVHLRLLIALGAVREIETLGVPVRSGA